MAKRNDDFTNLIAAAILGAGAGFLIAGSFKSNTDKRDQFLGRLRRDLEEHGVRFIDATFGRTYEHRPVWTVTYQPSSGETRLKRVELALGAEPYADSTANQLVAELV